MRRLDKQGSIHSVHDSVNQYISVYCQHLFSIFNAMFDADQMKSFGD